MKKYEFTDEMISFLVENQNMNRKELSSEFNRKFNNDYSQDTIRFELYKHTKKRLVEEHHYTEEQEKYIRENENLSHKEMMVEFNKKFKTSISKTALISKRKNMNLKKYAHHKYTNFEIEWIKSQPKEISRTELYRRFRNKFGVNLTYQTFFRFLQKFGIREDKRHHYTKEQNDFLIENVGKITYKNLTELFNEKFNANVSLCSLRGQCLYYLDVKQGFNPRNHLEIGTKVKSKNGYQRIKTTKQENLPRNVRWKPMGRLIYEQHYGEIPNDCVVIFLDRNKDNLDISNLYCITKKIHAVMASHRWFTDSREHTLTAIKWCELYFKLKERE